MNQVELLDTGIIYRNPKPHVKSENAYFPSITQFNDGDLVASMAIGQAFESPDQHVYSARSSDAGITWEMLGPIYKSESDKPTSEYCRISAMPNNEMVAFLIKYDRSRADSGLTNEENMGFVETELTIVRSFDKGKTWSVPRAFSPPLEGPCFEMCCPIKELKDGRWIIPTSTWRGWDGYCPNGMKAVAFVSFDRGETWPEYIDIMADAENRIIYWESRVIQLADNRLLAVAWAYDEKNASDLQNHFALSDETGNVFGPPTPTGINGQTLEPLLLDDGRILSIYRRVDKPGLWANISRVEKDIWINEYETPIWGYEYDKSVSKDKNMVKNFNVLRFGAPSALQLPDGTVFVAIWAAENCVGNIRWFRLAVK